MILLESLFRERGIGNMGGVLLLMSYIEWGSPCWSTHPVEARQVQNARTIGCQGF
jgi:hypothetical protein